ncbi:cysteine--tRNA ligase [Sneathia sanguinegens]|uniref:Cysteine--tRNA ligase n=1 Tax=Sneathia sanguinegens TaxID=40543 RepID=A0ABT7HJE3_9FUSO|nr:cysteine--tRNA ligase [Sneathia sanguinegens]MDK9580651.1 cysteine--tRNA ligase [Sneathia sanguinegens]
MMKLYNTLTNKLEDFVPIEQNKVKMYVCGPTVYNYIHIGNARPIIVFDVLARIFKYKGYTLQYVQNFTDIDDKIIKKANEEGKTCDEISEKYIEAFLEDIKEMNVIPEIIRPRVTENLDEIKKLINNLLKKGYAYKKGEDVIFSINKYNDYGKLSNQDLNSLTNGVRIEVDEKKDNPNDFVLWKGRKANEPYYESDFGLGRPGWHIECSAMIHKYLGNNIDIHAGGQDLIFPHHENERAQSNCGYDVNNEFVNYWLHNSYITINSEKMSKSLGNFKLLRDILKSYNGNVIRHFILTCHYRKNLNFSTEDLEVSKKTLEKISKSMSTFKMLNKGKEDEALDAILKEFKTNFILSLEDDINTPKALACVSILIKKVNKLLATKESNVERAYFEIKDKMENILGIKLNEDKIENDKNKILEILLNIREKLRQQKNYELADKIREELAILGIDISDKK